ncbi:hypothetical protein ACOSQ3_003875 [Xanthoceras sorbifolium]
MKCFFFIVLVIVSIFLSNILEINFFIDYEPSSAASEQTRKKMDKSNGHVSIDFRKLAYSLRDVYTPNMVSIDPFHHSSKELKAMEEYKLRYFIDNFLMFIKDKETNLRNCYAETIKFGSKEFVEMILLDVVFLIEILLGYIVTPPDSNRKAPKMLKDLVLDIVLLENKIPKFILEDLVKSANPVLPERYNGYSLSRFTRFFFNYIWKDILIDETFLESYFSEARHFVNLLRLFLQPLERDNTERQADSEAAPSVKKLHQAGIKFKLASSTKNFLDITYSKGTLEIPKLTIGNMTVHLLINLLIFEALHCGTNYTNDYAVVLNRLLRSTKDNRIPDSERVSTLFRELSRDARVQYSNFYYSGLVKDLQDYCKSPCHMWKANLKQNYFNTAWASIYGIAVVIILALTFI